MLKLLAVWTINAVALLIATLRAALDHRGEFRHGAPGWPSCSVCSSTLLRPLLVLLTLPVTLLTLGLFIFVLNAALFSWRGAGQRLRGRRLLVGLFRRHRLQPDFLGSVVPVAGPEGRPAMPRADQLLVVSGLAASRTAAQRLIAAGRVRWAGDLVAKPAQEIPSADALAVAPTPPTATSPGAARKAGALAASGIEVAGKTALDLGQSTGGFTDCLLQAGAARVVGVDVGHGQLHPGSPPTRGSRPSPASTAAASPPPTSARALPASGASTSSSATCRSFPSPPSSLSCPPCSPPGATTPPRQTSV